MTGATRPPSLARSVTVTAVGNALPPVAALITAPMLAQGLGVEARGQLAAAQAIALLAVSISAFGLPEAITYFVASGQGRIPKATRRIVALTALIGTAATAVVLALSDLLSHRDHVAGELIGVAGFSIVPSLLLGLVRGYAAGRHLWGKIAAERILGSAVRLVGTVTLLATGLLTPTSATVLFAFGPLLAVVPYTFGLRRPRQAGTAEIDASAMVNYGSRVWIGAVSGIVLMRLDQALLVPLSDATQLGLYAVAVAIGEIPLIANSSIRDVSFARHSGHVHAKAIAKSARVSLIVSGIIAMSLAAAVPWGVPLLFGSEFTDAVPVTYVLLIAVAIGTPGSIAGAGLSAMGSPGLRSRSLTIAAGLNALALLAIAPYWGALGAGVATLVGNLVSANLNIRWFNRRSGTSVRDFYLVRPSDVRDTLRAIQRLSKRPATGGLL